MQDFINIEDATLFTETMQDQVFWKFDSNTNTLIGLDMDEEGNESWKPFIQAVCIFGRTAYVIQDGKNLLTYRSSKATLNKMACIMARDFLKALSVPRCADYRVPRPVWDAIVDNMKVLLSSDPEIIKFFKA